MHVVQLPQHIVASNSNDYKHVHYTFDFAQSISIPHHSRQLGPLYFLSLRKIHLFGLRLDGLSTQFNFVIDEAECIGQDGKLCHGANSVISMLHFGLWKYGVGEKRCILHADNCGGQNRNQFVIGYFAWRIFTGRHHEISYLMQIPGHTKCLVDAGFAHVKRLYRKSDCESVVEVSNVINRSTSSNKAVLFANEPEWKWYDWKTFLSQFFKPIPHIQQYQHFRFHTDNKGVVFVKKNAKSVEIPISIIKSSQIEIESASMPQVLSPSGLSLGRQQYLYKSVRPYVRPQFNDVICPQPDVVEE